MARRLTGPDRLHTQGIGGRGESEQGRGEGARVFTVLFCWVVMGWQVLFTLNNQQQQYGRAAVLTPQTPLQTTDK